MIDEERFSLELKRNCSLWFFESENEQEEKTIDRSMFIRTTCRWCCVSTDGRWSIIIVHWHSSLFQLNANERRNVRILTDLFSLFPSSDENKTRERQTYLAEYLWSTEMIQRLISLTYSNKDWKREAMKRSFNARRVEEWTSRKALNKYAAREKTRWK